MAPVDGDHFAMTFQCPLCGGQGPPEPLYVKRGICRCPGCGLVFYNGPAEPSGLYTERYFAGEEYRDYVGDRADIQRNFADRVAAVRRHKPAGRLLEIGAAYGFFLDLARAHWQVRGIDVVPEAVAYGREKLGLDMRAADFLDLPDEPERYDAICLWDTIEHLRRPVETIRKAARWLAPGGVLAITTNDIDSSLARLRGGKWRQIHPPSHLFYFSARTLEMAVRQAGLETVELRHVGFHRRYKSMMHGLFVLGRRRSAWLYHLLTAGGRIDFSIYLNLGDIMMLIARKGD